MRFNSYLFYQIISFFLVDVDVDVDVFYSQDPSWIMDNWSDDLNWAVI
jgi:hypothetical protein